MPTISEIETFYGQTLYDSDGDKIGEITDIFADRSTNQPQWLAVKTGLFGTNVSFVPLEAASSSDDGVRVSYDKKLVEGAPNVGDDEELSPGEERRLYEHYSRDFGDFDYDREYDAPTVARDASNPATDQAMTRSEEEVRVGTARVETGRARLRKYVVTEQVQTTVPVQREEVRLEREPITDANAGDAMDGPAISEEEHEVTLHAEEPVVEKRVVPKERVRLDTDTVVDEVRVTEEVRKEQIKADDGRR